MALTFPLSISDFFKGLRMTVISFDLSESSVSVETGGGEILRSDVGPRLWEGSVSLLIAEHRDQAAITAKINTLRQAGREFYVFDPTLKAPRLDPDASILGSATPTISSIATDNRHLSIEGLPAGYKLSAGDMLSFVYDGRQALHQVVVGAAANSGGITGLIEVIPHIRPTAAIGADVTLHQPVCKAVMLPDTVNTGAKSGNLTRGVSFKFRQTLR